MSIQSGKKKFMDIGSVVFEITRGRTNGQADKHYGFDPPYVKQKRFASEARSAQIFLTISRMERRLPLIVNPSTTLSPKKPLLCKIFFQKISSMV